MDNTSSINASLSPISLHATNQSKPINQNFIDNKKPLQEDNKNENGNSKPINDKDIELLNTKFKEAGIDITVEWNTTINRDILKFIDQKTNKVVQQLPPEGIVKIIEGLREGKSVGLLINGKT